MIKLIALLCLFLCASFSYAQKTETWYVHAANAQLKAEPKMDGAQVASLKRGDTLQVVSNQGVWYEVEVNGKKGWISKLFIGKNKPVGQAELANDAGDMSVAKSNRRRSSSYSVSAATRGLTAGARLRENREQYRADEQALQKMENQKIDKKEVQKFKNEGGLNQ